MQPPLIAIIIMATFIGSRIGYVLFVLYREKIKKKLHNPIIYAGYDNDLQVMTVKYTDGKTEHYQGARSVWRKLPDMKRCNTTTETWLGDLYAYNQHWNAPFPQAYKESEITVLKKVNEWQAAN